MLPARHDIKRSDGLPDQGLSGLVRLLARQAARECLAASQPPMQPAPTSNDTSRNCIASPKG